MKRGWGSKAKNCLVGEASVLRVMLNPNSLSCGLKFSKATSPIQH